MEGVGVEPGGGRGSAAAHGDVVVAGHALPLAAGPLSALREEIHADVRGRQVVDGRMAGLQHPLGAAGVGQGHAVEADLDESGPTPRRAAGADSPRPTPDQRRAGWDERSCRKQYPSSTAWRARVPASPRASPGLESRRPRRARRPRPGVFPCPASRGRSPSPHRRADPGSPQEMVLDLR